MPDSGNNAFVLATYPTKGAYVILETNGEWGLPGGGVKKGESLKDGAVRELREETGIRVNPKQLQKIQERPHGSTKSVVYAVLLDQALDYDKIFAQRKRGETKAYSYAVIPHWASTPHVLNQKRQLKSVKWRGPVKAQFQFFPRVSKIEEWTRTLIRQNRHLSGNTSPEYVRFVLERCAASDPTKHNFWDTLAYTKCMKIAETWKDDGIFREGSIDEYRSYLKQMRPLVHAFFAGFSGEIKGYRKDSNHLNPRDRDAWPVSLCKHAFAGVGKPELYHIASDVDVFPIFLFDRKGKQYNECEVVALSAHNKREHSHYSLTKFIMPKATPVLSHADLGISQEDYENLKRAQAQYDATFCDLAYLGHGV